MKSNRFSQRLNNSIITSDITILEAMKELEKAGTTALMLCDEKRRLLGVLSDGDIRRAVLNDVSLDNACHSIACLDPITATAPVSSGDALNLMTEHDINHLPVIDSEGIVQKFLLRKDFLAEKKIDDRIIKQRLKECRLPSESTISQALKQMEIAGTGALVICDDKGHLLSLITDGDIRRAILQGKSLNDPFIRTANTNPITLLAPVSSSEALRVMNEHDISHLPVLDSEGRVKSFLLRKDLTAGTTDNLAAVIMAGGYGTRLRPLTEKVPKPMLPVGDRPLLELTIDQLKKAGIEEIHLTTHYLPDKITEHFGNGDDFGVRLNYIHEENPLGTAGGLKLLGDVKNTILVINGDVLTGVPFQAMNKYHRWLNADLTVGVKKYEFKVPFGVVDCEDVFVKNIREKPTYSFFINTGTYLVEPTAFEFIPGGCQFDMTQLTEKLLEFKKTVVSFPIIEYWLDIGKLEDYQQVQKDILNGVI